MELAKVFIFMVLLVLSHASKILEQERQILDRILASGNYDKRIRASGNNGTGPAVSEYTILVRSIESISDVNMDYKIQMTFRSQWKDERLKYDDMQGQIKYLTITDPDMVWKPDVFFKNEKEGRFHNMLSQNNYLRIFPDGNVLYSTRITLTLSCPMDFKLFPFDKQQCQLLIASYGWTIEDIALIWKSSQPVRVGLSGVLSTFILETVVTDYCNSKTSTGVYSCLRLDLIFQREFSYYISQYYIPCIMLVIVSWLSFWLDRTAILARVALVLAPLLAMHHLASSINDVLPPVYYTRAIDVWTGSCITFIFVALLEIVIVNFTSRFEEKIDQQNPKNQEISDEPSGKPMEAPKRRLFLLKWLSKLDTRTKKLDFFCMVTFPLAFVFFNIGYWSIYSLPVKELAVSYIQRGR